MTALKFLADPREQGGRPRVASAAVAGPVARTDLQAKDELHERLRLDKKYVRTDGCYIYDADGVRYADFAQSGALPLAAVDELTHDEQRLVRQAAKLGEQLRRGLEELQREFPVLVADVRGHGLTFADRLRVRSY